ncbi:Vacuolar protein sorting-associated protein 51 isoform 1 [Schistosoma japonicum]|uniref:Vacuolar protein sorting-associated protein 51 homolog n=1 Tax=Schistosoma japonicum TaxID=6182 RepID=A0A4Z2DR49_SCHJA|nr:Vacuolar protein sorting-associated protein 51 isoform 1 [Schistosoma japonicum]
MEEDLQRKAIKQRLKQFYGSDTNSSLTDRDDPLNIDSPSFDAHLYLDKSLKTKDLSDLISEEKVLTEQIRSLDSDMQTLVYDNYSKFINATDTIRMMKSNFSYVEAEMNLLLQNIGSIVSVSGTINESLADKRKKLSTLTTTQLTLNKLNYLVELPLSLRKYMNKCDWDQTVLDLNKAKYILKSYHNTPSFRSIREDCAEIISEICSRLWRQFEESSDVTECSNHLKILQQLGFSSQKLSRAILRLAKRQISQRLSYIKTLVCEVDKPDINRDEALDSSVNFGNDFVHEPPPGERDILYFANLITDSVLIKLSGFIRLLADFYFTKSDESEPMDTILDIISGKTENSSSETDSGCFDEYLSNVVEELMHEFFILVRNRFELESTNTDINLLIRALDRIYCRVQTFNRSLLASVTSIDIEGEVDDLNPQSLSIVSHLSLLTNRFSNSALEIISQVARVQTTYYFDILCQNAVESFTDLRHKLASHGLQTLASNSTSEEVNKINKGENDIRQLSSLLDSLSSSLVSQLRNVLSAEEAFLNTKSTFSNRPQFRNSFCIDQIREGLIVGYLNFLVQFLSDLAKTAVCKVPGPILLILGKLCLMWADSGTVGHLISLADDFMLLGLQTKETGKDFNVEDVSRPITTVKDISNRFKCTGNELLITFVRLEGTNLAQLLRKSVEARDWLKNLEPRTVRSAVKRVIEDLVLLDHQTLIECARLQTFGRYGLQQIQVDCRYLQIHLWHFVNDEKLICMLLEDVIYSVVQRCVDPSFMEESVSLTVKSNYF